MKVNVPNLVILIKEKYRGNQTFFAQDAGINRCYLNRMINSKAYNNSSKMCNSIIKYCEENNLNYKDYIFLD